MTRTVFGADEQADHPVDLGRWVRLAEGVLEEEGVRGDVEVSLLFVDEEAMASLHKRFLGGDGPTDVLAFPIDDEPVPGGRSPDGGGPGPGWVPPEEGDLPTLLGDVVICPAVAWRNASERAGAPADAARDEPPGASEHDVAKEGRPEILSPARVFEDEIALLVVHGLLHLQGMDHEDDVEAEEMQQREQELLGKLYREAGAGA